MNVNFKIMSMEDESRHVIAYRLISDITMSIISSALCEDTRIIRLVSVINIHEIKPEHKPTIPDTPLPTPNIAEIKHERHRKLTPKMYPRNGTLG